MKLRTAVLVIITSVVALFSSSRLVAQTIQVIDDANLPRFEVVSVKPSDGASTLVDFGVGTGRFHQQNASLVSAVMFAFGVRSYQVADPSEIIRQGQFTIDARIHDGAPQATLPLMVRALLIDRFKLRYHVEARVIDGYELTRARQDGRLGPDLRVSSVDCAARILATRRNEPLPPLPPGARECNGFLGGFDTLTLTGMRLSTLAQLLSNQVRAPVLDRTALNGNYDVDLHFSPGSGGSPNVNAQPLTGRDDAPTIFTAVQEQLGLKLTPGKAPVDVLVIDHIERPDPD